MDAKVGDWVVTPRHGKPVCVLVTGPVQSVIRWIGFSASTTEYEAGRFPTHIHA
jgi:hypothetical protein